MPAAKRFVTYGEVVASLPNNLYRVKLPDGHLVLCSIVYQMTRKRIKVVPGDTVTLEITATDLNRGRIVYRGKRESHHAPGPPGVK